MSTLRFEFLAFIVMASACAHAPQSITEAPVAAEIRLSELLAGQVNSFEVSQIDMPSLLAGLAEGTVTLLLVDSDDELREVQVRARPVQLRDPDLSQGFLKTGEDDFEPVFLPPERNFTLGECKAGAGSCGALTVLGEEQTMIAGMLFSEEIGLTFFEPVDLLLGGRENPGLHLLYNVAGSEPLDYSNDSEDGTASYTEAVLASYPRNISFLQDAQEMVQARTSIVLDGSASFYEIDRATVWSRQEAIFNSVRLYLYMAPLVVDLPKDEASWSLLLTLKGQEVWTSGGPNVNTHVLNTIRAPGYFLLNPVTDKEVHFFFLGRKAGGTLGQARLAGLGSSNNHAWGTGASGHSFLTRWNTMLHEVGHLLNGAHQPSALKRQCFSVFFSRRCGVTVMYTSGLTLPFFSEANDRRIAPHLRKVLP